MEQKFQHKFTRFQNRYGWNGKSFSINIRPLFYFRYVPTYFTIPDFYIELFKENSVTFVAGHVEWYIFLKVFRWEKAVRLR
jgi:nitric oxide synthase oxygenase domain/subunit